MTASVSPACRPSVRATRSVTRAPSASDANSTHHTPSGKRSAMRAATCRASLVLPQPPAPVSVTSRDSPSSSAPRSRSPARPTNVLNSAGRLLGTPSRPCPPARSDPATGIPVPAPSTSRPIAPRPNAAIPRPIRLGAGGLPSLPRDMGSSLLSYDHSLTGFNGTAVACQIGSGACAALPRLSAPGETGEVGVHPAGPCGWRGQGPGDRGIELLRRALVGGEMPDPAGHLVRGPLRAVPPDGEIGEVDVLAMPE